ncbi:uncharacterized protein TNCV_4809791 [Trichonephila clavipes]|nr:uncharacterized protein TNCV_4809791 [Trichonephila clavipes]
MTGQGDEFKFQAPYSKPSIKLSTYDGKSSWQVYKTQFSIVADANQWDSQTKARQLAASLRADAADILPETQRLDFDALANRFGVTLRREMCEGLQQTPAEVTAAESVRNAPRTGDGRREAFSPLALSDCPTEVREVPAPATLSSTGCDPEIQKALRVADLKGLKGGLGCLLL